MCLLLAARWLHVAIAGTYLFFITLYYFISLAPIQYRRWTSFNAQWCPLACAIVFLTPLKESSGGRPVFLEQTRYLSRAFLSIDSVSHACRLYGQPSPTAFATYKKLALKPSHLCIACLLGTIRYWSVFTHQFTRICH